MKKLLLGLSVIFAIGLVSVLSVRAFDNNSQGSNSNDQEQHTAYNPNRELSDSSCGTNLGNPVIDVTQKVQNDADSGQAGNYWAFDYYTRHIQVWKTNTSDTYCAIVTYNGHFYTIPGQIGPGNTPTGALINTNTDEPVNGDMTGGRRATIVGTLLSTPGWPTQDSVGTTNYQCNITDTCPGVISWPDKYFNAGYSYNDVWWGWQYTTKDHGTWTNAISGDSGNIL